MQSIIHIILSIIFSSMSAYNTGIPYTIELKLSSGPLNYVKNKSSTVLKCYFPISDNAIHSNLYTFLISQSLSTGQFSLPSMILKTSVVFMRPSELSYISALKICLKLSPYLFKAFSLSQKVRGKWSQSNVSDNTFPIYVLHRRQM